MQSKMFKGEANKNNKYYRVIQTEKAYSDGRKFPIDEVVIADKKVNLRAETPKDMGGFCISTYEYIFRWIIRGDTLCEVIIPEDSKIYETQSNNGIYISNRIILTNPRKIDDNFAMELYLNSKLPEESYFKAMTAAAICGYMNTALKVCEDKVNIKNVDTAILEISDFCKRRKDEHMINDSKANERVNILMKKLNEIKSRK